LNEVFRRMPEFLDSERTRGLSATIEFRIEDGDARDRFLVTIEDGRCEVAREGAALPRATLRLGAVDLLKLATGNASAIGMVLVGRLRVGGDVLFAARVQRLFRIPSA
jgi:putative sterol carrier protein